MILIKIQKQSQGIEHMVYNEKPCVRSMDDRIPINNRDCQYITQAISGG